MRKLFHGSFKITSKTGLAVKGGSTLIGGSSIDIQEGLGISPTSTSYQVLSLVKYFHQQSF